MYTFLETKSYEGYPDAKVDNVNITPRFDSSSKHKAVQEQSTAQ